MSYKSYHFFDENDSSSILSIFPSFHAFNDNRQHWIRDNLSLTHSSVSLRFLIPYLPSTGISPLYTPEYESNFGDVSKTTLTALAMYWQRYRSRIQENEPVVYIHEVPLERIHVIKPGRQAHFYDQCPRVCFVCMHSIITAKYIWMQ